MTFKSAITKRTESKSSKTASKVRQVVDLEWNPRPYMLRALKFLLANGGAGLLLDPGLGKTAITLAAIKILINEGLIDRAVVIAPLRVIYDVWPAEIAKWTDFNDLKYVICHGSNKDEAIKQKADIYLVNPEGLEWLVPKLKKLKPHLLVVDESTKFKNPNSKRFKLLKTVLPMFRRRWILTGTPTPNGLLDLFGQIYIVDCGHALGRYITHFRNQYFDPTGFGGFKWRLREGMEKLIYEKIRPCSLRLQAEDFLDLPELLENDIKVTLPVKAEKVYREMEEEAFAVLDGAELNAVNAAAATSKCRQIANGAAYLEDKSWRALHAAKLEALESVLEERGGRPVLVAYEFVHDYEHACEYFKEKFPRIGGGVSPKRTSELITEWNAGHLPVLFVHPASAGHGLNMQECKDADCIVWLTPTWDLEHYDQLNRRIYRQGTKAKHVIVHRIIASGTVDLVAARALRNKNRTQKSLLDALKDYRKGETK